MASDKLIRKAKQALTVGNFEEAEKHCKKVLRQSPRNINALNLISIVYIETNRIPDAIQSLETVRNLRPNSAMMLNNLAFAYQSVGEVEKAIGVLQNAAQADAANEGVIFNLAVLQSQIGQTDEAIQRFQQVLSLQPKHAESHYNIANLYADIRLHESAETHYKQAIQSQPDLVGAWYNLGQLYESAQRFEQAIDAYEHVVELDNSVADAFFCLGNLYQAKSAIDNSVKSFQKAIKVKPKLSHAYAGIVKTYLLHNQFDEAVSFIKTLTDNTDALSTIYQNLPRVLELIRPDDYCEALTVIINLAYEYDGIDHQLFSNISIYILKHENEFKFLFHSTLEISEEILNTLSSSQLFINTISKTLIIDARLERSLNSIRGYLLQMESNSVNRHVPLTCALATLCFNNEYCYDESEHEKQLFQELSIQTDLQQSTIATLAMYAPLYQLENTKTITSKECPDLAAIIKQQIVEPELEHELKKEISSFSDVDDDISLAVQAQYEESPYPRWTSVHINKPVLLTEVLAWNFPYYAAPEFCNHPVKTLVAGCGTGKHLISVATRNRYSQLTTIDLSKASIAYAKRKSIEYGITDVEFIQADILKLEQLNNKFHVIESAGVLHHLHDPVAGWKVLCNLLEPSGLMRIGLYSDIARGNISAAREFINQNNYSTDPEGIRTARRDILNLPDDHEISPLKYMYDFYSTSACRDLIFHVQEHCYDPTTIEQILDELGLKFLGFEHRDSNVNALYHQSFPDDPTLTSLKNWHRFEMENPDTFAGMYQFWCQKK